MCNIRFLREARFRLENILYFSRSGIPDREFLLIYPEKCDIFILIILELTFWEKNVVLRIETDGNKRAFGPWSRCKQPGDESGWLR